MKGKTCIVNRKEITIDNNPDVKKTTRIILYLTSLGNQTEFEAPVAWAEKSQLA